MLTLSDDHFYRVPEWKHYAWLDHGFGTRLSPAVANLGVLKQIHSADVRIAEHSGLNGTGDALISRVRDLRVAVRTADCLPILLIDPSTRSVGAIHAGWRGTVQGIATRAVDMMCERFGASLETMEAAIGPGIGLCCFEVGPEVAREFGPYDSDRKTHLDLQELNRKRLVASGIRTIHLSNACTYCGMGEDSFRFFSYRREGDAAGRMISYAGITPGQATMPAPVNFGS